MPYFKVTFEVKQVYTEFVEANTSIEAIDQAKNINGITDFETRSAVVIDRDEFVFNGGFNELTEGF
jgi:hypothetical protein